MFCNRIASVVYINPLFLRGIPKHRSFELPCVKALYVESQRRGSDRMRFVEDNA